MTALQPVRLPPLRPTTGPGKLALSCHKDREFLIRAWCPSWRSEGSRSLERLVGWVLHHVGRLDQSGLEWWCYLYEGRPHYMGGAGEWESGLTIQRFVAPPRWVQTLLDEGRIGPAYGSSERLRIPENGVVVAEAPLKAERVDA